jgi:hypothetical protein
VGEDKVTLNEKVPSASSTVAVSVLKLTLGMIGGTISLLAFTTFCTRLSMMDGGAAVTVVVTELVEEVLPVALNTSACAEDKGATILLPVIGLDKLFPVIGLVSAGLLMGEVVTIS